MEDQPKAPAIKPSKVVIVTGVVLAFTIPLASSILLNRSALSYSDKIFFSRFIFWGVVGILWLYARMFEKQGLLIWPEKRSGTNFILKSVGMLYLLALAAQCLSAIPGLLGWHENNTAMKQITVVVRQHPMWIMFISITAGFTEEMIFRAYMLTRLSVLFTNRYTPVILSSLLFAALHYRYNSPHEYIFTFLFGVITSVHYQKYGNITPLIILHFLVDLIGLNIAMRFLK